MKKKSILAAAAISMATLGAMVSAPAQAASQDECAIWLCLPGGFPTGCAAAHAAMVSRLKDFKPPLPAFSSCSVTPPGGSNMTSSYGPAAYIPERRQCSRWHHGNNDSTCLSWETLPERYVRGTSCRAASNDSGEMIPAGCTRTVRFIEVFADGEQLGPTYWW